MSNKNYVSGRRFEYSFIKKLLDSGEAIKAGRFYASKGVTDVWFVDKHGKHNEAQLKYSKKTPRISRKELDNLKKFAKSVYPQITVWLVMKKSRSPQTMELVN